MNNFSNFLPTKEQKTELMDICKAYSDSDICPKNLKGKPSECYIIAMKGMQQGLDPFTSFESICAINGKAMLYGDAIVYLGSKHPNYKAYHAKFEEINSDIKCIVTISKKEGEEFVYSFSKSEAQTEGCLSKDIWRKNLKDMLWRRATRKAFKICFPEMFIGVQVSEANNEREIEDLNQGESIQDITAQETKPINNFKPIIVGKDPKEDKASTNDDKLNNDKADQNSTINQPDLTNQEM